MRHIIRPKGTVEAFLEGPVSGHLVEMGVLVFCGFIAECAAMLEDFSKGDAFILTLLALLLLALWLVPAFARLSHRIEHPSWYKRDKIVTHVTYEDGKEIKRKARGSFADMYEE
ncbi:hypothetical protein K2Q00_03525 [Patescibacteria group bacterium]|nr:hypothetical protein [Patescibacteria group bacterium]